MTTTTFELADRKLFDGQQYSVSQNTDLAGSGTTSMLVENPPDSGTEMYLFLVRVSHEVETDVAVYTDVDSISGGTAENIAEDNVGGSQPSDMEATTDATYNTTNEHFRIVYVGTAEHDLMGGVGMVIQPGHNIVVELTNNGSSNSQVGLRMVWIEKPA